jgi:hypothetical protein
MFGQRTHICLFNDRALRDQHAVGSATHALGPLRRRSEHAIGEQTAETVQFGTMGALGSGETEMRSRNRAQDPTRRAENVRSRHHSHPLHASIRKPKNRCYVELRDNATARQHCIEIGLSKHVGDHRRAAQ